MSCRKDRRSRDEKIALAAFLAQPIVTAQKITRVGVEPTASLVLSQGGLPIAYRAVFSPMPKAGVEPADTPV